MNVAPPPLPWLVAGRLQGVDVSAAQWRALPWQAIRHFGCTFASIKAAENLSGDVMFERHAHGALLEGLELQAYGFLHSAGAGASSGIAQAEAMARVLDRAKVKLAMRECMDWEDAHRVDPKKGGVGARVATGNALGFLRTMTKNRGRRSVCYSGEGFMQYIRPELERDESGREMLLELATFDLWVAAYRWDPKTGHDYKLETPHIPSPWSEAYAWQCGGNGSPRIPYVDVDLDRDVFYGDLERFHAFNLDTPTKEAGLVLGTPNAAATSIADEVNRASR